MSDITVPGHDASIHARAVAAELTWLEAVIETRMKSFLSEDMASPSLPVAPTHDPLSALANLINRYALSPEERVILALTIAPHINLALLDVFYAKNAALDRPFSQFGIEQTSGGVLKPTAKTALFLLAGVDTEAQIAKMKLFDSTHSLCQGVGLSLAKNENQPSAYGALLDIQTHRVIALCDGSPPRPDFSSNFPARRLSTSLEWDDLVLSPSISHQLDHITAWLENRDMILSDWGFGRQFGRGYKSLFYGPPGTGKTLTASLLGKRTGLDVYRIDLSMVVSKYIGETEKNLGLVFDLAEEREWILFFDEADALFGERTSTSSSNDRFANQEVSYLLQRIEECQSLVILATNLRGNIDDAFFRRFQISVHFKRPDQHQRLQLWRNTLSQVPLAADIDLEQISTAHDLSGASIVNVARHSAITARRRGAQQLAASDLQDAISSELRKEGRTT